MLFKRINWYFASKLNALMDKREMYRVHNMYEIWLEIKFYLQFIYYKMGDYNIKILKIHFKRTLMLRWYTYSKRKQNRRLLWKIRLHLRKFWNDEIRGSCYTIITVPIRPNLMKTQTKSWVYFLGLHWVN